MENFRIRKLIPADMEQMFALHRTRDELEYDEAEKRTKLLEWLAFKNPFVTNGEATYFVAEDSGKIVAYHGRMPIEFMINGRRRKGYYVHDLYVDPEYRKKGKGFWLTRKLAKAIEEESDSFFCLLGMTPLNLAMQKQLGYYGLPPADVYVKLLNPRKQLTKLFRKTFLVKLLTPIFRKVIQLVDWVLFKLNSYNMQVIEIDKFDSRFDDLNQRIIQKIGISSNKNSEYLNWKYIDRPFKRDTVFAAEKNGRIMGFVVVAPSPFEQVNPTGIIVDIMADPEDSETITALCKASIVHFRTQGVDKIACILSDKRFAKVLKKFLFYKSTSNKSVLLGNLEKCDQEREFLTNISNWHFTRGESDSFMLSP